MPYSARALVALVGACVLLVVGGCAPLSRLNDVSAWLTNGASRRTSHTRTHALGAVTLADLQVKGSHNSYHRAPWLALAPSWRYTHSPLDVQLASQGVRQLELDVRYEHGEILLGHLPWVDGRTNCRALHDCLELLKRFSNAHPEHTPVFVFIEPKESLAPSNLDGKLEALDREITRVFSRSSLLVPEDVAGSAKSLRDAVSSRGWPSLDAVRGRFAFVLFGPVRHRAAYSRGRPRLDGRVMFVADLPEQPHTAVLSVDDPVAHGDLIARALQRGQLVRTRADEGLLRDRGRRDAALASGAHFVGTDFVDPREGWIDLGRNSPVRCNPVTARAHCSPLALLEAGSEVWAGALAPRDTARGPIFP